jgi:hypothetical protein
MDKQGPIRGKRHSENDLPNLRQAGLLPRPRAVLEQILTASSALLEQGIAATFNDAEQQLFKQAEQARSVAQQNRCFEALREIRRGRSDVAPRFVIRLEAALATIDKSHAAPQFSRVNRGQRDELVLVDEEDFEESLALQEVASRSEIRNSALLCALGQRFGVLAGSKAFEPDELPIGPHRICDCFREAVGCIEVGLEFRMVLYRALDRACSATMTKVFETVNQVGIEQRILPNLALAPVRGKRDAADAGAKPAGTDPNAADKEQDKDKAAPQKPGFAGYPPAPGYAGAGLAAGAGYSGRPQGAAPATGPARGAVPGPGPGTGAGALRRTGDGARPPAAPAAPGARGSGHSASAAMYIPDVSDIPGAAGFSNPMTGWPGVPSGAAASAVDYSQDPREAELFETMRDLMAGRRHALGLDQRPPPEQVHQVRTDDLQSVLGALQARPVAQIRAGGKVVHRSIGQVKQVLLNQLRQLAPENKNPQLDEVDNDTIDLVGMLFEHLGKDAKPAAAVNDFLTRLQVPLLRVALKDKSFFTRRTHPARQLLNAIAEAGLFWFDEESEDRQLVEKMGLVVDRVTAEFDGDLNVFDELLTDLSKHLGTLSRKSEVAERRHVDAAKGRERLDLARTTATRAIAERIADRKPPPLIRTLLEQAWADVLALTILRQGEHSDAYRKRLEIADQLIAVLDAGMPRSDGDETSQALKHEVETGLTQVGYHVDDISAVVNRLFGGEAKAASEEDPSSLTEIAIKLKARSRLGSEADVETTKPDPAKTRDIAPLNAEEQRVLERLRTVPFGTWFAFKTNQQGDSVRRKMSWFSTMTGRCLFVNQRGARTEEKTLEQLAREIVRGQASVVEAQAETLIDRAWGAIMGTLKQFTGGMPTPAPT